ncbi:MAG TPA: AtpZ/AtpI family protein, partial [Firmicutes bacterium]|nr:AtpZ/AtpI family protein [Bacillota bacterium]
LELGLTIVVSGGLGWWIGLWLDSRLGYNDIMSIIGLILGIVGGLFTAYQLLQKVMADGGFKDG